MFQEEPIAINSSGLFAGKAGAYHHNQFWKWTNEKFETLELTEEPTPELLKLKREAQGLISIIDLFLKSEKESKQNSGDNGQQ